MDLSELLKMRKGKFEVKICDMDEEGESEDMPEEEETKKKSMPKGMKMAIIAKLKKKKGD